MHQAHAWFVLPGYQAVGTLAVHRPFILDLHLIRLVETVFDINASRLQELGTTKGGSKKSKNRSIKYVCPCCGTIIRATREVNVICGDCGEPFERA